MLPSTGLSFVHKIGENRTSVFNMRTMLFVLFLLLGDVWTTSSLTHDTLVRKRLKRERKIETYSFGLVGVL